MAPAEMPRDDPGTVETIETAQPVVFGAGCVGWLHRPSSTGLDRGVVLCAPFGYEGLSTYRVMRALALRLAASGLAVLRFDYPGSGESAGEAEEPPAMETCIEAAVAASDVLRARLGLRQVAFAGCRFGALVAAQAAGRTGACPALALLAPVISGRAYARALRLQAYRPGPAEEPEESSGYPITRDFLDALATFDLRRLAAPARRVLLFGAEEEAASLASVAPSWTAQGAIVEATRFAGAERLLAEAHGAEAPDDAFRRMVEFLCHDAGPAIMAPRLPASPDRLILGDGSSERVVRFGPDHRLVGTWCEPAPSTRRLGPALLIAGTGANMRAGNGRLSVLVARRAARLGIPSLRYDSTGVGDSDNPQQVPLVRLIYSRSAIEDARHAMDWLADAGHASATAIGTCAGAYVLLQAAIADPRLRFVIPVNLQRFEWRDGRVLTVPANRSSRRDAQGLQWRALRDAMRARARPVDLVRALLPPAVKHAWKRTVVRGLANLAWRAPLPMVAGLEVGRVRAALQELSVRGTRVLLVYCSDDTGLDEFEAHLGPGGQRLARLVGLRRALVPGGDHVLSTAAMRSDLIDLLMAEIVADAAGD